MARFRLLISIYIVLFTTHLAYGQRVLVEEKGRPLNRTVVKQADDSIDFRQKRKVGVGLSAAGVQGLIGANIELNFTPETSLQTHFGIASNYQSFGFSIKRVVGGKWFSPYISGGITRWYTATDKGPIRSTTPGFLAKEFLSERERSEGKFSEILIYPALGIQYNQLQGSYAGSSVFVEILMLIDIDDFASAPTGSLGYTYYF